MKKLFISLLTIAALYITEPVQAQDAKDGVCFDRNMGAKPW